MTPLQIIVTIILLALWLKFGAFTKDDKKEEVDYDYVLHNVHNEESKIVYTTYHKYLMTRKNGRNSLKHLESCENLTHKLNK